jgi:hypothetical protein
LWRASGVTPSRTRTQAACPHAHTPGAVMDTPQVHVPDSIPLAFLWMQAALATEHALPAALRNCWSSWHQSLQLLGPPTLLQHTVQADCHDLGTLDAPAACTTASTLQQWPLEKPTCAHACGKGSPAHLPTSPQAQHVCALLLCGRVAPETVIKAQLAALQRGDVAGAARYNLWGRSTSVRAMMQVSRAPPWRTAHRIECWQQLAHVGIHLECRTVHKVSHRTQCKESTHLGCHIVHNVQSRQRGGTGGMVINILVSCIWYHLDYLHLDVCRHTILLTHCMFGC